jgi:signal transduction histidine kinase
MPDSASGARHTGGVTAADAFRARLGRRPLLHPWLTSALLVAVFIGLPMVPGVAFLETSSTATERTWPVLGSAVVAVMGAVAIVLRRRWPIPLLVAATAVEIVVMAATGSAVPASATPVLFYAAARWTDRRSAVTASAALVAVYVAVAGWRQPTGDRLADVISVLSAAVVVVALGDWRRSVHERSAARDAAVATRLAESQRQLVEQRLRIARELHDVVAHQMAVINVQSAVAEHLVRTDPEGAAAALSHVRTSAGIVLQELGGLLQLLRADTADTADTGDTGDTARAPNPTLDDLDPLVASFGPVGLHVERTDVGTIGDAVPEGVQLAIYRLVQEALTNAHRYGDGRAQLSFTSADGNLTVEIVNAVSPQVPSSRGAGLGVIGMQERVMAAGGTLEAGMRNDGRFGVRARFPVGVLRP